MRAAGETAVGLLCVAGEERGSDGARVASAHVPLLSNWGTPLLLGPGSIHVAHTDDEHVAIDELRAAVGLYEKLAARLLH